ncbi:MAG: hypothetical protein K6G83_01620 [Lachnospiraceae bacterium]|nr:hypothetical protein [Lachnospiraceae bacterium]
MNGSLKTACQISDALVLQYFEESDPVKAAFGKNLTAEEWESIAEIKDVYGDVLFSAPLISVNVAHPLLEEMQRELQTEGREFSFLCGHDSNLASVLASLEAEDYSLPNTIEKRTPIGAKLVISKWNKAGKELISLDLVYQKTEQLRGLTLLDDQNPPEIYNLRLKGLTADQNGMYQAADIFACFQKAINSAPK